MEKILGFSLNNIISGDTMESLIYRDRSKETDGLYIRNMYSAEDDGVVLLEDGNVEYKKGDLLVSFEYWRTGAEAGINKVINASTTDLGKVFKELMAGNETV